MLAMMAGEKVRPGLYPIPPMGIARRQSSDVTAVEDPNVALAARFIRENACSGIGVAEVVAAVPLARRLLEKRFRAMLGRTLREELTRVQMQRAKELLSGTDLALAEIADRVGIKHVEYLTVVFKRECGWRPARIGRTSVRRQKTRLRSQRVERLPGLASALLVIILKTEDDKERRKDSSLPATLSACHANRGGGCRRGFLHRETGWAVALKRRCLPNRRSAGGGCFASRRGCRRA